MNGSGGFKRLFRVRSRRGWVKESVDLEIRHHIETRIDELIEEGHRPDDARRIAEDAFGDRSRYRAECMALQRREERKMRWRDGVVSIWGDAVHAVRGMRRHPGLAAAIVLTLGVGLGASTAIFAIADAVVLRPLGYAEPDELFTLQPVQKETGFFRTSFPVPLAEAWAAEEVFSESALYTPQSHTRTDVELGRRVRVAHASSNTLAMLGASALLGRGFFADDARAEAPPTLVIGEDLWQTEFARDPEVLGRSIDLDGQAFTIVGVMPRRFRFPRPVTADAWAPLRPGAIPSSELSVLVRRPRETNEEAFEARLDGLARIFSEAGLTVAPLHEVQVQSVDWFRTTVEVRTTVTVVGGAVALLLIIALANGINLLLVRGSERTGELAIRAALGAGRGRLARQLVVESMVVATMSGVLAVGVATVGVEGFMAIAPSAFDSYSPHPVDMSGRALAFTFSLALLAGVVFGTIPGFVALRPGRLGSGLSSAIRDDRSGGMLRNTIVVAEVSVSVMLLVGGGLLLTSLDRLASTDPGFVPQNLLYFAPGFDQDELGPAERLQAYRALRSEIESIPGVQGVALSNGTPLAGVSLRIALQLEVEGRGGPEPDQPTVLPWSEVGPDFLPLAGARLVAGRWSVAEDAQSDGVVIDQRMAEALWPDESPVGRRFRIVEDEPWLTVVGVVEDIRSYQIDDRRGSFDLFKTLPLDGSFVGTGWTLAVRTADGFGRQVEDAVTQIGRRYKRVGAFAQLEWAEEAISDKLIEPRFVTTLVVGLSTLAAFLTSVGLYGTLSYSIRMRWRELGIRVALGAAAIGIRRLVLARGLRLTLVGLVAGLVGSALIVRMIEPLLYETAVWDPLTYGGVALLMSGVGVVACLIPARRATRVDPVEVLRAE